MGHPPGFLDQLHHHPDEAEAIRSAVAELLGGRTTLTQIAERWTQQGLRRRQSPGRPWEAAHVFQVLRGDRIGGIVRRNGVIVDEPPKWLPIITRSSWDGLQVVLRDRDLRSRLAYNRVHLGRGIAKCGRCGADMHHAGSGNRSRYVCVRRTLYYYDHDSGERHPQIADHLLEGVLRSAILDLLMEHGLELTGYRPRTLDVLTRALGAAQARLNELSEGYETEAPVRERELQSEIAVLEAEADDRRLWQALVGLDNSSRAHLGDSWDRSPLEARHTILRRCLVATVDPGRGTERVRIDFLLDA